MFDEEYAIVLDEFSIKIFAFTSNQKNYLRDQLNIMTIYSDFNN